MNMDINFRANYITYNSIINTNSNIFVFHFFKDNKLLYTKNLLYNYDNRHYYRISKSVLNLFYEKQHKFYPVRFIILLTDIYVNKDQRLIYMNAYNTSNSFCKFIIGIYYKFLSREYIYYDTLVYYFMPKWIDNFYYYNHYITNQEINNVCNQLATYGESIKLLYTL